MFLVNGVRWRSTAGTMSKMPCSAINEKAPAIKVSKDITKIVAIVRGSFVTERTASKIGAVKYAKIIEMAAGGTAKIMTAVNKTGNHFVIKASIVRCLSSFLSVNFGLPLQPI